VTRPRLAPALPVLVLFAACSAGGRASTHPPTPAASPTATRAAVPPGPSPAPGYPAYYVESLRRLPHPGGAIQVGARMARGTGYTKSAVSWPSQGQTMTGTISIPDGGGPFPVVIVNHGHIPVSRYWVGQDSGIFGDPMAAHGFISIAPNYPGYAGSGSLDPAYPDVVAEAVADLDLVSSLHTLAAADLARVAMIGHSNGGGVSMLVAVVDPAVRALALFAPISSDMADNSRKWWRGASRGAAPDPDLSPVDYLHMSPRTFFNPASPPTIFLQGTADEDIPRAWTEATLAALRGQGVETATTWYPGALHDLVGGDLADADARAEAWIRAHLAPR
jgi:dipeptidyl aminopeptidase/acylaminoacyl peptidase